MTPLEELRRDLADVLGWLLVRAPRSDDPRVWVTVTRPPSRRELGLVAVEGDGMRADWSRREAMAGAALRTLGYKTGRRTWGHITVEHAPLAHELSAHRRIEAWRRIEGVLRRG